MSLVQMTLSGGALILLAAAVRELALRRLPKGAFLALWEIAALRMLLPFTVPLPWAAPVSAGHLPAAGGYPGANGAVVDRKSVV